MINRSCIGLAPFLLVALVHGCAREPADLVISNARIYTVNHAQPWAEAMAVRGNHIVYIGSQNGAEELVGPETEIMDVEGRMVMPGIHDAHVHPDRGEWYNHRLCQAYADDEAALIETIRQCASESPDGWVVGYRYDFNTFDGFNPTKEFLDAIVADRPVAILRWDSHAMWVNSAALDWAGYTKDTPDPPGGELIRDPETGELVGVLIDSAYHPLFEHINAMRDRRSELEAALIRMNAFGITSYFDALIRSEAALKAYRELDADGQMTARASIGWLIRPDNDPGRVRELYDHKRAYTSGQVQVTTAKIFLDGNVEDHMAYLTEPYPDIEGHGTPYFSCEQLADIVSELADSGLDAHIHVIGDGAARLALDVIEDVRKLNGDQRFTLAHLCHVHPGDVPRFAALDVTSNVSPVWAYPSAFGPVDGSYDYMAFMETKLGKGRAHDTMFLFRSIVDSGGRLTGSSDWFFTSLNPFDGLEVAITRKDPSNENPAVLDIAEALTLEQAIDAYTINAAFQLRTERSTGSLELGKFADFIVLDRNLFDIDPTEISETQVLKTIFNGKVVYDAERQR